MYYEDKLINGQWIWRSRSDSEWQPMTPEMVAEKELKLTRGDALELEQKEIHTEGAENSLQGAVGSSKGQSDTGVETSTTVGTWRQWLTAVPISSAHN